MTTEEINVALEIAGVDILAGEINRINIEKGWVTPGEDANYPELTANLHAEVSELWEEYRNHHPALWFSEQPDGMKPEGALAELADVVIRALDAMNRIAFNSVVATPEMAVKLGGPNSRFVFQRDDQMTASVFACVPSEIIALKLVYNSKRPYRHGGKKA